MAPETPDALARKLEAYLAGKIPGARDLRVSVLGRIASGFSRENWPFDAEWREDGRPVRRKLILRRDPVGSVIETSREPEFRLLRVLEATDVPAPAAYWMEADGASLDRPFIVMERVEGVVDARVLTDDNALGLDRDARLRLARRYCALLAEIHALDWRALGLGKAFAVPDGSPAVAELDRTLRFVERATLEPHPEIAEARAWLERRVPPSGKPVLVHGDFRPENTMLRGETVVAILDWELARFSDPLADLAWYTMPINEGVHFIPGAWEKRDFLRHYAELTGNEVDQERLRFWEVLVMTYVVGIAMTAAKSFVERRSSFAAMTAGSIRRFLGIVLGMIGG